MPESPSPMALQDARWQDFSGNDTADPEAQFARHLIENDPAAIARGALLRAFSEIHTTNKKRSKRVEKLKFLIRELYFLQPAELTEISGSLGQSLNTTREQLQKLIKVDLVVRVAFEENTLYCINGHYNKFINDILDDYCT